MISLKTSNEQRVTHVEDDGGGAAAVANRADDFLLVLRDADVLQAGRRDDDAVASRPLGQLALQRDARVAGVGGGRQQRPRRADVLA